MHAAVISQEPTTRDYLAFSLRQGGFSVTQKVSVKDLTPALEENVLALVVLNSEDPQETLSDLQLLRKKSEAPAIVLGENFPEKTTCTLLQAGADLVLKSPCSPRLLIAYCQVLLRRSRARNTGPLAVLDLGSIRLNSATYSVQVRDQPPRHLTPLEFRLMHLLMTSRGAAIPADVIVERVWGYSERGNRELVRGLVSRLRAKVERDPASPAFIHTIPGVGYLFEIEQD